MVERNAAEEVSAPAENSGSSEEKFIAEGKNLVAERTLGLRERKKARLRQQIIDTAIRLFRAQGYENTRVDEIIEILEISQPTFFRYFPTKSAVLMDAALHWIDHMTAQFRRELTEGDHTTAERLRGLYLRMARATEADRPFWRALVLSGTMDPVVSPQVRAGDKVMVDVLQEILIHGQERGEVTGDFPILHMAQSMDGIYKVLVWKWAGDIGGPHSFADRVATAVEIFLRGIAA